MSRFHFLNVREGNCLVIEHNSGRVTMKDICNGNGERSRALAFGQRVLTQLEESAIRGNFRMCQKPTQPLDYLSLNEIKSLWRFVLSHPDMDHLDGLDALFESVPVEHYWDSGVRREKPEFKNQSRYKEPDWDRYERIIGGRESSVKVIKALENARFQYANKPDNGSDGLHILAPNKELIDAADEDTNDASYVLLYRSSGGKILMPGDAHDNTWKHLCEKHADDIRDCEILVAPHHGRDSGMDFGFLKTVNPQLVLFGCAPSENLAYDKYSKYAVITNNQAGNIVAEIDTDGMDIFVQNEKFAEALKIARPRSNRQGYNFVARIQPRS